MTWLSKVGRVLAVVFVALLAISWLSYRITPPQSTELPLGEWTLKPVPAPAAPPNAARRTYRATMGIGFPWKQVPIRIEWLVERGLDGCDHIQRVRVERTGGTRWLRIEGMTFGYNACQIHGKTVLFDRVTVSYRKAWVGIGEQLEGHGIIEVTAGGAVSKLSVD